MNPPSLWPRPRLHDVLLLIPSYRGLHPSSLSFVQSCIALGADLAASWGCSDPAMHRCLVAGQALERIQSHPGRYRWVVWLDDDMVATPSHVAGLIQFAEVLETAVAGSYCKRGNARSLTWKSYPGIVRTVAVDGHPVQCYPVTSGMGCLALSVDHFVHHCSEAPAWKRAGESRTVPGICACGMSIDDGGGLGWRSEDQVYCEGLWTYGVGLYGVPIEFAHISEVALHPAAEALWLGDLCEFPDEVSPVRYVMRTPGCPDEVPPPTLNSQELESRGALERPG